MNHYIINGNISAFVNSVGFYSTINQKQFSQIGGSIQWQNKLTKTADVSIMTMSPR